MAKRKLPENVRERNGKYHYRYDITDPTSGNRKQKETKGFATPQEAKKEGIRIQSELLNGTFIEEQDIMFSTWVDRWLEIYKTSARGHFGTVKPQTVKIRRDSLIRPKKHFAGIKLREITQLQYQSLLADMKSQKYSEKTIRMLHEAMGLLFRKAVQMELIKEDITSKVELPVFQQTVEQLETEEVFPEYLEKEELALFLKTAKQLGDGQMYRMLVLLAYTGLRIGELCALKTSDIDEVNQQISITKNLNDRGPIESFTLETPKTKSSVRKVDIWETAIKILKEQAAWRKEYRLSEAHRFYTKEEFVFVNNKMFPGRAFSPHDLQRYMKLVLEHSKLPSTLSPHSLRHTYTSLMAEAGVELPAIQRLLGHQNDNITRKIYLHVTKAKKREAVEKLDNLMSGLF